MPVTSSSYGTRITNAAAAIHAGPGRVTALVVSHLSSSAQPVILYDSLTCSGTILAYLFIAPEQCPAVITLPGELRFSTGLSINAGSCEVNLWACS